MDILKIAILLRGDGRPVDPAGPVSSIAVYTVNTAEEKILSREDLEPPSQGPDEFPKLLAGLKVGLVLAPRMAEDSMDRLLSYGVEALAGFPSLEPDDLVLRYMADTLVPDA